MYIACDIHSKTCQNGRKIITFSDQNGNVEIPAERKWNIWLGAPGGIDVSYHIIVISSSGYCTFLFSQAPFNLNLERPINREIIKYYITRQDILALLEKIPQKNRIVSKNSLVSDLPSGNISLYKLQQCDCSDVTD